MAVARGAIRNHKRARQQIDFSGLKFRNITPTDMDGWFEYDRKCFVFFEFKYREEHDIYSLEKWEKDSAGQKWALERMADSMTKPSLLVVAQHSRPAHEDIDGANASVVAFRVGRQWKEVRPRGINRTVHACVVWFLKQYGYEDTD